MNDETIKAVVGHNSSRTSRAAAAKYEDGKLVMVSPTSGASNLAREYPNYVFRTVPPASVYAKSLAERIYGYKNIGGEWLEKIAICYDSQDTYSQSFKNDFKSNIFQLNSENPSQPQAQVFDTDCDLSVEQFNPQEILDQIKSQGADALVLIASVKTIDKAAEIAKAQGEDKLPLFGSTSMYAGKTLEIGEEGVEGMLLIIPWYPHSRQSNQSFLGNAFKLWGGRVSWRTALAYDATKVIIEGLKKSETREGLQEAFKSPNFSVDGASGKVKFDEGGDRVEEPQDSVIIRQRLDSQSGTEYDFEWRP
ncbi:MAG: ABC transporter substrate-binding protein [Okeania sp. SIO2H7]|nr:ABC transporter substrate-binding protein [Okeania sp. SIO2H7]